MPKRVLMTRVRGRSVAAYSTSGGAPSRSAARTKCIGSRAREFKAPKTARRVSSSRRRIDSVGFPASALPSCFPFSHVPVEPRDSFWPGASALVKPRARAREVAAFFHFNARGHRGFKCKFRARWRDQARAHRDRTGRPSGFHPGFGLASGASDLRKNSETHDDAGGRRARFKRLREPAVTHRASQLRDGNYEMVISRSVNDEQT